MYFFNFSTWTGKPGIYVSSPPSRVCTSDTPCTHRQLEDLFVDPEYRGKGLGKALFGELGKIAEEKVRCRFVFLRMVVCCADSLV